MALVLEEDLAVELWGTETAVGWGVNGWGGGDAQEARHVDSLFDLIMK